MRIDGIDPSTFSANRFIAAGQGTPTRLAQLQPTSPSTRPTQTNPTDPTHRPDQPQRVTQTAPTRHTGEVRTTAYQRTADGDDAVFSSKRSELTEDERRETDQLKARDREVRVHEEAHVAAGGNLVQSGPHYDYRTGPDGNRYAVSGHVTIDTSPAETPEQTIAKAERIRAAALAPAEPSSADRAVAAKAMRLITDARRELAEHKATPDTDRGQAMIDRVGATQPSIEPVTPFDPTTNAPDPNPANLVPSRLDAARAATPYAATTTPAPAPRLNNVYA